ncbi:MAG: OmpA family protein [Ghiorsea sp.]|nr:OmpA family protein [Ghiorsea sp.]
MKQYIGITILAMFILSGCQSISDEELEALHARAAKAEQLQTENAKLKQSKASLQQSVTELNKQLEQEVAAKQVLIEQNEQTGVIKVTLQQDILFSSGSFKIDQAGAADILKKVIESIDNNDGKIMLRIVGHTDNLPVAKKWRKQFSDNWDLSARRAGEVARYLTWGLGFPRENITVAGRADVEPVTSNDTPEDRAKNRRIELFIEK